MEINTITATFGTMRKVTTLPILFQYDVIQMLQIEGLELPAAYEVDFCNDGDTDAITMIGGEDGVQIPDTLLATGRTVKGYLVLTDGDSVQTRYEITIPVTRRPIHRSDLDLTEAEKQQIDSLIDALNTGVERAEDAADSIRNMNVEAETLPSGSPAEATWDGETDTLTLGLPAGEPGGTGPIGPAGQDGVSPSVTVTDITGGHLVTIIDAEHPTGQSFDVMDGAQGPKGDDGTATDEQVEAAVSHQLDEAVAEQIQDAVDEYLQAHPTVGGAFSNAAKYALLSLLEKVAYIDEDGQEYLDTLEQELFTVAVASITAVYTQSGTVYDTDDLDSLRDDLVVTANYVDGTSETVTMYTLSGTLTVGTSTVTVSYGGKTDSFNVTISPPTREMIFGIFESGYTCAKSTSGGTLNNIWRQKTAARAVAPAPVLNKSYVFTVTDSTKYNITVYDVTSLEHTTNVPATAVDGYGYVGGTKSISWKTTDSVSTPYVWLALKKMNNTAFTAEELANGAEAVFTYTEGS